MKLRFDPNDVEELTSNAKEIQDDVLEEILTLNANTEYLRRFLHGSSDKELFKKNVPIVSYDDVRPYIERVANGEPSNVISGKPVTRFILSSGTSGGKHKCFPVNNKFDEDMLFIFSLRSSIISKHIEGIQQGKAITFLFSKAQDTTPSGLPAASALVNFLVSDSFKNRPSNCYTSPDEVTLCPDHKQTMYCHLLCGLVQRDQVVSMASSFGSSFVGAITFLENHWKEMCSNIRSGHVSEWITNQSCRDVVANILGGPNAELADLIEEECCQKSWEGKEGEIVDLVNVKLGCYYEPLVTNYYGLHRYRIGDILQVTGFYNSAPQFRRNDGSIRALEIRVVQQGTFDSVMEYFISNGASPSQYKTPLCINSPQVLSILEDKVLARFFSDKFPPL
ncbi:hypothetical protein AALP_AA4G071000 [Arabis alpina]|uniref:GH3 C-terminal domain-containing protein n=1 Tax=Arabis alpina TaxID=50452 RepID=A0A087H1P5_ARAAL|nr:hypothetical protein AALP_AA4G071000 [Arabis alpina]